MARDSNIVDGKYELRGVIARGGMASVWRARHLLLGTNVAIKFIDAELLSSDEARSRFAREARASARIDSRHAVKIFDTGVTPDGKPFIVMELLEGETLGARLSRRRRLGLVETSELVDQIARGLKRAHELGIVHRDLKPENIYLCPDPDGGADIAKILDFGIAKVIEGAHDLNATAHTKAGSLMGTPAYMSPEQARGLATIDHRTDLWSLGVVVFRAITGRDAFHGKWPTELLLGICEGPAPSASAALPGLAAELDPWFSRAFARDPARRFQSAAELAQSFGAIARRAELVDDEDPTVTGDGTALLRIHPTTLRMQLQPPRVVTQPRSDPPPTGSLGAVALMPPGSPPPPPAPSSRSPTSLPAKTSKRFMELAAAALVAVSLLAVALFASRHAGRSEGRKSGAGSLAVTNAFDAAPDAAAEGGARGSKR